MEVTIDEAVSGMQVVWYRPSRGYKTPPQRIRATVFYKTQDKVRIKITSPYGGMTTRVVTPDQLERDEGAERCTYGAKQASNGHSTYG